MNAHPRVRGYALIAAAGLGVLGDQLMQVPGPPGLNVALWSAAGLAALSWLVLRRGWSASSEAVALLGLALFFVGSLVWRDAAALRALNLLAAASAAFLAAGEAGAAWIRRAGVADYAKAAALTGIVVGTGPVLLTVGPGAPPLPAGKTAVAWRRTGVATVRGAALALPALLVFGGLLTEADPVFARVVTGTLRFDVTSVVNHIVVAGFFAWVSAGYFYGFLLRTPFTAVPLPVRQPRIPVLDAAIALGLLNALFLAFVIVQVRYLFGGSELIEVTPGLGYAEYARRGFFELVAVSALVVPLLLLAEWAVHRATPRDERVFRISALLQVVLLFAIMASAVHRMRLYQQAYGLTELRLYTTVFMAWVAVILLWLASTVLRARRQHFAFGALVAAFIAAFALNVMNPHALIVRVNAGRSAVGHQFDARYPLRLSGDAVPTIISTLPGLPAAERCLVSKAVLERWTADPQGDWRTWNYGDRRARRAVGRADLAALCSG